EIRAERRADRFRNARIVDQRAQAFRRVDVVRIACVGGLRRRLVARREPRAQAAPQRIDRDHPAAFSTRWAWTGTWSPTSAQSSLAPRPNDLRSSVVSTSSGAPSPVSLK